MCSYLNHLKPSLTLPEGSGFRDYGGGIGIGPQTDRPHVVGNIHKKGKSFFSAKKQTKVCLLITRVSDGGARRRAPAELLRWHHVESPAVSRQIHLEPPQRRRPAPESRELLRRQPGGGGSLRTQEAAAHGNVDYFICCSRMKLQVPLSPLGYKRPQCFVC